MIPEITTSSGNQKVRIFEDVVLVCQTTGKPKANIRWHREDAKPMSPSRFISDKNGSLRIKSSFKFYFKHNKRVITILIESF